MEIINSSDKSSDIEIIKSEEKGSNFHEGEQSVSSIAEAKSKKFVRKGKYYLVMFFLPL